MDPEMLSVRDYCSLLIAPSSSHPATEFPRRNAINVIFHSPGIRWCAVSPVRVRNEQSQGTPKEQSPRNTVGRLDVVQIGGPPGFRTLARSFVCSLLARSLAHSRVSHSPLASACELNACVCMCVYVICFRPRTISKRHMCSPENLGRLAHRHISLAYARQRNGIRKNYKVRKFISSSCGWFDFTQKIHAKTFDAHFCARLKSDRHSFVFSPVSRRLFR